MMSASDDRMSAVEPLAEVEAFIEQVFDGAVRKDDSLWIAGGHERVSYGEDLHEENAGYEEDSFWFRQRNALFLQLLKRFGAEAPIVDIGGGTGIVGQYLTDHGFPTINIEPTESGAALAAKRRVPTVIGTLQSSGLKRGAVKCAGMFDVLEHMEDDATALADVASVLAPGGLFMIAVPAHNWLWSSEDQRAGHFRRYTRSTLRERLEAAGLTPLYVNHLFAYLVAPLYIARTLGSGGELEEDKQRIHVPSPPIRRIFDLLGRAERKWISLGRSMPLGTSVVAVARKNA